MANVAISSSEGNTVGVGGGKCKRGASADQLAQRNGITTAPAATQIPHLHEKDPTSVDSLTWSSGDHTPIAVLSTVHGGGHVVPQPAFRYPRLLGRTADDLDAPSLVGDFMSFNQIVDTLNRLVQATDL